MLLHFPAPLVHRGADNTAMAKMSQQLFFKKSFISFIYAQIVQSLLCSNKNSTNLRLISINQPSF